MSHKNQTIGLTEVIQRLRADINKAVKAAKSDNNDVLFNLGEIEIELQTVITKKGKGGFSLEVPIWEILKAKAQAEGDISKALTQKIKIKLNAQNADGRNIQMSDDGEDNSKPKVTEE